MTKGYVKWWNDEKGFGFVTADDGTDMFAHYSEIEGDGYQTLKENERVEFDVGQGQRGPQAQRIRRTNTDDSKKKVVEPKPQPWPRPTTQSGAQNIVAPPSPSARVSPGKQSHVEHPVVERGFALRDGDPQQVGPYSLLRHLGEGAMGTVYLAARPGGGVAALKVVRSEFAQDETLSRRFIKEVETARRVQAFCTATVLDAGIDSGRPYLVTEFIDGPTLEEQVRREGALSPGDVHNLAVQMAAALVAIHEVEVIHRDLKPSNVILSKYGPKVIDFGISHSLDSTTAITQNMVRLGTPAYMSPEHIESGTAQLASDVFSWGGVIIFAATGKEPFGQGNPLSIMFQIMERDPKLDGVPEHLKNIVSDAMHKNPHRRPAASELLARLASLRAK
ncbi:protein kinase domain-containing protein [Amycolatopsis sp. NPDC004378]